MPSHCAQAVRIGDLRNSTGLEGLSVSRAIRPMLASTPLATDRSQYAVSNRLTGECFTLHVPGDKVDSYSAQAKHADENGVAFSVINYSNTFQDDDHKLGPVTHSDQVIWQNAIDHHFECIDIMKTGSRGLKVWIADGTNCPGQDDIRARQNWLADSLALIYKRIGRNQSLVLECKFFEPVSYQTNVPARGTTCPQTAAGGDRARATSIEFGNSRAARQAAGHDDLPYYIPPADRPPPLQPPARRQSPDSATRD
jgi:hypothetical protein